MFRFLIRLLEQVIDFLVYLLFTIRYPSDAPEVIYPFEESGRLSEFDLPDPSDDEISRMEMYDRLFLGYADGIKLTFSPVIPGQKVGVIMTSDSSAFDLHDLQLFEAICLRLRGQFINEFNLQVVWLFQKGYVTQGILDAQTNCWLIRRSMYAN